MNWGSNGHGICYMAMLVCIRIYSDNYITCYNTSLGYKLNNLVSSGSKLKKLHFQKKVVSNLCFILSSNCYNVCTLPDASHVDDTAG